MKRRLQSIAVLVIAAMLSGCATRDLELRRSRSAQPALDAGWTRSVLDAGKFSLIAFTPRSMIPSASLSIYIEGDGLAWLDASTPSFDPTPLNPLALRLALRDPSTAVAYLARPCQYTREEERRNCSVRYWTSDRFSKEVIDAADLAVGQLKARAGATNIRLIGYSGGAAVAALVAAHRKDVSMLVSVAGNLDTAEWTRRQRISPLSGSLNPADFSPALQAIAQQHYVGGDDDNIDASIARSYAARFQAPQPSVTVIPRFTHLCCWEDIWPELSGQNFGLPGSAPP
ncbi:alpha/beta hydrolase [Herbaspirillum sp. LeCh32-8]|uniref:alpha/beta hydrolase n=1 Tax=Herbaspirillum sp. LeCh32-8 TaxID=2821356 RepID=UPI001AE355E8|nr:alpha/beta hydrolase [Herbaspirillum sp. LeCh32-8]MBP0600664.1 alpha/beta hydrolase [Herbaspirillum sp. LeCh32-8]